MSAGLLVIGSGPAGLAAARAYRENDGPGPVRMVSADVDPPYNRPPLSKDFLRGDIDEAELALVDAGFFAAHDITLRLGRHVRAVDPGAHTASLGGGETLDYDRLVIATGASPTPLPVPGAQAAHVLQLRSLVQGRALRAAAETRSAVVIGSGFIGCEAAASLRRRGVAVTLVTQPLLLWLRPAQPSPIQSTTPPPIIPSSPLLLPPHSAAPTTDQHTHLLRAMFRHLLVRKLCRRHRTLSRPDTKKGAGKAERIANGATDWQSFFWSGEDSI